MINLKLACYNEKGEFKKFLELSNNGIQYAPNGKEFMNDGFLFGFKMVMIEIDGIMESYHLEEKDPFHRFDGLFDGRTYGEGRFVLIKDDEDKIEVVETFKNKIKGYCYKGTCKYDQPFTTEDEEMGIFDVGNTIEETTIHENPELWSKIK